ncbi:MAG: ChaN family lipoprotein [Planctomycetota bacterium]|jgi:uncharacterized iron-regulated protein|nr:ChaN family lipoprotein [Planctomycetota bacterium]
MRSLSFLVTIGCLLLPFLPISSAQEAPSEDWLNKAIEKRLGPLRAEIMQALERFEAFRSIPPSARSQCLELESRILGYSVETVENTILSPSDRKTVSYLDLLDRVSKARAIYVGEHHDQPSHHQWQARIFRGLHEQNPKIAIGVEMLPFTMQSEVDRYVRGEIDEATFLQRVDWKKTWGFSWELYRPLFLFARTHRLPVIALNVPRTLVRAVGKRGLSGLTPEERDQLPRLIDTTNESHRKRFWKAVSGHGSSGHHPSNRMYEAMCVWDESMARSVARFLANNPTWKILVVAGSGHVAHFDGIPARAAKRIPHTHQVIIPLDTRPPIPVLDLLAHPPGDLIILTRSKRSNREVKPKPTPKSKR